MQFQVYIENTDGTGRIELSSGDDPQKAADLCSALAYAASGKGFDVGMKITATETPPAGGGAAPAAARGTATAPNRR